MGINEAIGQCPICNRDMWKGSSIDRHHMVPKCRGGKETEYLHKVCHRKIHSIWTEKELEREYNNPDKIIEHEEMQKFIKWLSNKEPDFYTKNDTHKRKR